MKKTCQKILAAVLCVWMLGGALFTLSGCSAGTSGDGRLHIVATIFPEYDWAAQIAGLYTGERTDVELTLLLDTGVDLHSYQPTAADMITISTCDLFLYVGGESDKWVSDALKEATNKNMKVLNLLSILGEDVKEEELREGMEAEEEQSGDGDGEEEIEYDEHVWLSLKNAKRFCRAIADTLSEIDKPHADVYSENLARYLGELDELDAAYEAAVSGAARDTLLFGDRFPFRYLVDDYGLNYYAAFVGCSAETEASFKTVTFLASKADELGLDCILKLEKSDGRLAGTIAANTKAGGLKILSLDSMQSTAKADIEAGVTYLSLMKKNLDVLKEALG